MQLSSWNFEFKGIVEWVPWFLMWIIFGLIELAVDIKLTVYVNAHSVCTQSDLISYISLVKTALVIDLPLPE